MPLHVIIGAGAVGTTTATELVAAGHTVRIVSRRGLGPDGAGIERVAADATDASAIVRIATGAAAIYNCANPAYTKWPTDWPPIANALLAAAERTGAVLVTTSNLYGYGPVDHPMRESDPLAATSVKGRVRAQMWLDALAAHEAGRVRVTEARASDFIGNGADGHLGERVVPRILAGKGVRVLGDPDAPHSFTAVSDVARALVVLGTDERAWGRAWHVPTNAPVSQREAVAAMARIAGVPAVKVSGIGAGMLRAVSVFVPLLREMREIAYQTDRPFVLDSTVFTATFGLTATPMDDILAANVAWYRDAARSGRRAA